MKTLIREVTILSPGSPFNGHRKDILLSEGRIEKIVEAGTYPVEGLQLIEANGLFVSPGWFDLHVNFREPGHEYKEDLISGCLAAMQGGFTGVLCMPSVHPPLDNRAGVEYVLNRCRHELVDVVPAGCLSHQLLGKDLSEMYDMYSAGCRVFTDDRLPVKDAGLMLRALLYARNFGAKIFSFADEKSISGSAQMNEGIISTQSGLKGMPAIAEEVMIARDLMLAEYAGSPIHFSTISTKGSVELIRKAKQKGLNVTADVSALNLSLSDAALISFNTHCKVLPPLRTDDDISALIEGIKDDTIDAICSDHLPEDTENKKKEFELAAFGAEGIETAFAAAYTSLQDHISKDKIIEKFSNAPRRIAGLPEIHITENSPACLTIADLNISWTVREKELLSKSKNNPFLNKTLRSKALYVFNKGQFYKCS